MAQLAAAVRAELWTRQFTYTEARLLRLAILPVTVDAGRHTFLFPNREVICRLAKMTKGNLSDCLTHLETCGVLRIETRARDGVLAPDPHFSLRLTVLPPPYAMVPLLPEFETSAEEEKQLISLLLELDPERAPDAAQYELFSKKYGLLEALLDSFRGTFNFSVGSAVVLAAAEHMERGGAACARIPSPLSGPGPMRPDAESSTSQSAAAPSRETGAESAAGLAAPTTGSSPHAPDNATVTPWLPGESIEEHMARVGEKHGVPKFGTPSKTPAADGVPKFGTSSNPETDGVPKFGTKAKIDEVPKFGTSSNPQNDGVPNFGTPIKNANVSGDEMHGVPKFGTPSHDTRARAGAIASSDRTEVQKLAKAELAASVMERMARLSPYEWDHFAGPCKNFIGWKAVAEQWPNLVHEKLNEVEAYIELCEHPGRSPVKRPLGVLLRKLEDTGRVPHVRNLRTIR